MTLGLESLLADVPSLSASIEQNLNLLTLTRYTAHLPGKIIETKEYAVENLKSGYEKVINSEFYTKSAEWFQKNPELKYAGLFMLGSVVVKGLYMTGLIFPIMEDQIPHILWGALGIYGGYRYLNEVLGWSRKKSMAAASFAAALPLVREIVGEKNPFDLFYSVLGLEWGGILLHNYLTKKNTPKP